jgi:general stress protein 26
MGQDDITGKFWEALRHDRALMLGLAGVDDSHGQPMTAFVEDDHEGEGPVWILCSKRMDLVWALGSGRPAVAHFASKGHDVFATLHGRLAPDEHLAPLERLWHRLASGWHGGARNDGHADLQLLRFDLERMQVWVKERGAFAGVKLMLGRRPKLAVPGRALEIGTS